MAAKVHSFEDVKKHNRKDDCWLVIFGKVYDVTSFVQEHPGGDDILLEVTGKDATSDFEDIGHSRYAYDKMEEFYIGDLETSAEDASDKHNSAPQTAAAAYNKDSTKNMLYRLSLFIIGLAIFLRLYTKQD